MQSEEDFLDSRPGNIALQPIENAKRLPPETMKQLRHAKEKKEKRRKGKSKKDGQFQVVNASVLVSIPPKFSLDPLSGAKEMLDSLVMKYVPALQGVLLCHSNAQFVSRTAQLKNECPFFICTLSFDATVWSPQIGMKLTGKINLCSPDHISLLVHRTFNVSIPREHIPTEHWMFEYGPAENDPEFGPHAARTKDNAEDTDAQDESEPHGSWVHRITNDRLGGQDGILEFTVIGMTVANQMLSLKGSLQPDPFSPHHVPRPAVPPADLEVVLGDEDEREEVDKLINPANQRLDTDTQSNADDESEIEKDPFTELGRVRDEALKRQEAENARIQEERARLEKEEKKRRKKERRGRKEKEKALAAVDGLAVKRPAGGENPPKKKRKKDKQES